MRRHAPAHGGVWHWAKGGGLVLLEMVHLSGRGNGPDFDGWAGFWLVSRLEISANTMT